MTSKERTRTWRGIFPDHFVEVEAATEEEAEAKMIVLVKSQLEAGDFRPIAWEDDPQRKPTP